MGKLDGKVAVVTGGTSGIGLAITRTFAGEGAKVFVTGRRRKELDLAIAQIGAGATGVQGDASNLDDLDRLYRVVGEDGGIDILVANAGTAEFATLADLSLDHYDRLFATNVKGTLFTVQKALPLLRDGASIILMGSVASVKGTPGFTVYGATKAAIRNFVRTWSLELKDRGIRSNVISPGPVDTPATKDFAPDALARLTATVPMGRIGRADEVARAALYLASDDSSFVTGTELFVDGGRAQV